MVREPVDTLFDFGIGLPVDNEISLAQSRQPYKFSGKEFITSHGINQYNFGARYYDPALCRFTTMDPLAGKYYSTSPYAYCNNNPVIFVDPDGREIVVGSFLGRVAAFFGANNYESKVQKDLDALIYKITLKGSSFSTKSHCRNHIRSGTAVLIPELKRCA